MMSREQSLERLGIDPSVCEKGASFALECTLFSRVVIDADLLDQSIESQSLCRIADPISLGQILERTRCEKETLDECAVFLSQPFHDWRHCCSF